MKRKRQFYALFFIIALCVFWHKNISSYAFNAIPDVLGKSEREIITSQEALSDYLDRIQYKFHVPANLLKAIAQSESGWQMWTVRIDGRRYTPKDKESALNLIYDNYSSDFYVGVMQISKKWINHLGVSVEDALEPNVNIHLAAYILNENIIAYGATQRALIEYGSLRFGSNEGNVYVKRILAFYKKQLEEESRLR